MRRGPRRSAARPARALVLLLGLGLGAVLAQRADLPRQAWRAAYPHLPTRVQALPYRLGARLAPRRGTPVPLPTLDPARDPGGALAEPEGVAAAGTPAPRARPTLRAAAPSAATARSAGLASAAPPAAPTAAPLPREAPPVGALEAVRHEYQTWNNCGPATVAMALSPFDPDVDQRVAAPRLKPDPNDKNVSPAELARFARERGYGAEVIHGGDLALLTRLVAAGASVIVETWFVPEPGDEMGHYRLVTGYDAPGRRLWFADSYKGPSVTLDWEAFDADWRAFGRVLVAVYPGARADAVRTALGARADARAMWLGAATTARAEVAARPDAFGWFNLGTSLLGLGDPEGAAAAFDAARAIGLPWRMLWYQFGPYEAYAALGRWAEVEALAEGTLANAGELEESLYWRGRARAARGDRDGARADWQRAARLNPLWDAPRAALDDATP